ncbi:hypothetical protein MRB53_040700 [Persea americana]|nr:hypothetical protein MRB53_040700 [Persea americana]
MACRSYHLDDITCKVLGVIRPLLSRTICPLRSSRIARGMLQYSSACASWCSRVPAKSRTINKKSVLAKKTMVMGISYHASFAHVRDRIIAPSAAPPHLAPKLQTRVPSAL